MITYIVNTKLVKQEIKNSSKLSKFSVIDNKTNPKGVLTPHVIILCRNMKNQKKFNTGSTPNVIGRKIVMKHGLKVRKLKEKIVLKNASGNKIQVEGFCLIYVENREGSWVTVRAIVSEDLEGPILLSWKSQQEIGILSPNWSGRRKYHQETYDSWSSNVEIEEDEEDEEENDENEVGPPENVPENIRQLLLEYSHVFVKRLHGHACM